MKKVQNEAISETEISIISIEEAVKIPEIYGQKHFPKRLETAKKYIREDDRLRSMGAGALLYSRLKISEDEIVLNHLQKPFIAPEFNKKSPYFNISHSGNYVVLAIDEKEVGIDIEKITSPRLDVAKKVFLPEEQEWMNINPEINFFVLWTLKESVMKQCGLGFSLSPTSFSVLPFLKNMPIILHNQELFASTVIFDNHVISLCASHPIKNISPKIVSAKEISEEN